MAAIIIDSNANRIQGDFSDVAITNRTSLQTSTLNGATGVYALPNGSSTSAAWQATNNSDPTNASKILIATNGSTDVQLVSGVNGSGTYLPLSFYNSGDVRFQVGTSGELGVRTGVGTVGYGTSGQVLTSAGTGASPTWSTTLAPTLYYRLNSAVVGANATGAQNIFGVGVTLDASTQYEFELVAILSKTAGTTSHTVAIGFGGTATLNNIGSVSYVVFNASGLNILAGGTDGRCLQSTTASSTVVTGALTSATMAVSFIIKGTVSINAGGTFIPQYTLSAAPGGAYTTQIGSYMNLTPLGASGANISVGSWA